MSQQVLTTSGAIRTEGPPAATSDAQEKAHDPALVSPEPQAEALKQGALS